MVPLDVQKMQSIVANVIGVERELVEGFTSMSNNEQSLVCRFIKTISQA